MAWQDFNWQNAIRFINFLLLNHKYQKKIRYWYIIKSIYIMNTLHKITSDTIKLNSLIFKIRCTCTQIVHILYKSHTVIETGGVPIHEVTGEINPIVVCTVHSVGRHRCTIWYIWTYKDERHSAARYVIKHGKENQYIFIYRNLLR